ncbi:MAG: peptidase Ste24p [Ignavibacteria bacterium]|nr:peptidase Ste24p [Ignavibacteria bacterium]
MKKRTWLELLLILILIIASWLGFSYLPVFTGQDTIPVSIEQEEKLGKFMVDDVLSKNPDFKPLQSEFIDSCIWVIKNRLQKAVGQTEYDYKIIVTNNPQINAAALPGGYIIVFSGLIEFTENPEELASVLAHEIGHIEKRHIISRLTKEIGLNVLLSGDKAAIGSIFRMASSTAFDRRQEKEADIFSLELMSKAKINPHILGTFFSRLESKLHSPNGSMEILSTHPFNNSRIKAAYEFKISNDFKADTFTINWQKLKNVIKAEIDRQYDDAETQRNEADK